MTKRFFTIADLAEMPEPQWLIEGMFEAKSLIMLAGPSYSFKSFLLIDWLLCMASGRQWSARKTATCKVAYVLGEGKSSLFKRIQAWVNYHNLTDEELARLDANFRVTFEVPQLASKASVDNVLADLTKEDFQPDVIAIDTFARSFVGLDENDAKDTGLWIESADRLRQLGYCVIFLHHTKKNTEFGVQYRGSSAIIGAMDTAFTLTRDNNTCTLKCDKQKDHDEGPAQSFQRLIVKADPEHESCVLVPHKVIDSRFTDEEVQPVMRDEFKDIIHELLEDGSYPTNKARYLELAKRTGKSEEACRKALGRYIDELDKTLDKRFLSRQLSRR